MIMIAAIIGVLAGVLAKKSSREPSYISGPYPSSSHSPSPTWTANSTTLNPQIQTHTGPGGVQIECPSADQQPYTAKVDTARPSQTFYRRCDKEFKGADIMNVTASSMAACIDRCAIYNDEHGAGKCRGVTWNYLFPQGQQNSYCWLKNSIGDLVVYADREMAVLID